MLIALTLLVVSVIGGRLMLPAFADTSSYTTATEDLQNDESFDAKDYPDKPKDYSLQVIQIAESVDGELFVYTYQPSQNTTRLTATEINMSLSEDFSVNSIPDTVITGTGETDNSQGSGGGSVKPIPRSGAATKLYELTLINTSGVFCKYKVNDFTVSSNSVRYYNITSIYRPYMKGIDGNSGGITIVSDNTVNSVSYAVGKIWKVTTIANGVKYEMKKVETITITSKYVGSVRYPNGTKWFTSGACDSHFVAFSTNKQIDRLLEADVTYISQTYDKGLFGTEYGDAEKHTVGLCYDEKAGNNVSGIFAKSYSWNRIQSVNEFINLVKPTDEVKQELSGKQWVLNFAETDYTTGTGVGNIFIGLIGSLIGMQYKTGTLVSEVSILRLKFETDGITYNLGVVDNKQTGANDPIQPNAKFDFLGYVWNCIINLFTGQASVGETIVAVMALIVALIVVAIVIALFKWLYRLIFK